MLNSRLFLAAAFLGGMMVIGCDDSSTTPSGNPAPTPQASDAAADATKKKAEDAKDATESKAADAKDAMKDQAKTAADALKQDANTAADGLKKGADNAAEAVAKDPAAADATSKIQEVLTYIKENKLDLAETTLKKLEDSKASLPAAVTSQLDNARKMLDTAKAAAAAKSGALPAAPAVPAVPK
jgi:hypothetical protein